MTRAPGAIALISLLIAAGGARAQPSQPEPVASLISKLSSASFRQREAAVESLRERPDAEAALKEAAKKSDLETGRRIAEILRFFRRGKLEAAVDGGRVDRLVDLLGHWPAGEDEEEIWAGLRRFAETALGLDRKRGGGVNQGAMWKDGPKFLLCARKIQSLETEGSRGCAFLRGEEIDLPPGKHGILRDAVMVASGSVRFGAHGGYAIFAGGNAEIFMGAGDALVVACGDVSVKGRFIGSLIIAKGKVTCRDYMEGCHIISGSTVTLAKSRGKDLVENCVISENDSNPLGFIRWADAPKDKDVPKAKAKDAGKGP